MCLLSLTFAGQGCLLLGYEPVDPLDEPQADQDAGGAGDDAGSQAGSAGAAAAQPGGGGQGGLPDLGTGGDDSVGITDIALSSDAGLSDAGPDPIDASGVSDSGPTADASACPGEENACGGCEALRFDVGESCGSCGLGSYVCDGADAVRCDNADAEPVATGSDTLIDDFEDGDAYVEPRDGRSGSWYVTHDDTPGALSQSANSEFAPSQDGAAGSAYAARLLGNGFTDWGAALAVSLSAYQCSYDASAQRGLTFWARGTGTAQVSVATVHTVPPADGGTCFGNCYDHFGASVQLQPGWTLYQIPWTALTQSGWGTPAFFDRSALVYLELAFGPNMAFDVTIDDLRFY